MAASAPGPTRHLAGGLLPYQRRWVSGDLIAGITLAAVAIPEALGYAAIAGMPPQTGLYTCLLPVLVFAVVASSRRLVVGADSATAAISASAVGLLALGDASRFASLSAALAVLTGVLLVVAGVARLGLLADFMSRSVLAGFLTGVGIQIAVSQLGGMLGVSGTGETTWQRFVDTISLLPEANPWDALLAGLVIATIVGLGAAAPRVPGPLVAVVASMLLAASLDWAAVHDIAMVGALPAGLPALGLPGASLQDLLALVPTALVLVLVCVAQSVSTSTAFAIQHDEEPDSNVDLVGLGLANVAGGLSGTFVTNGSPTKTGVSDRAGGHSQWAMVVLALTTVPILLFLTGVFDSLPEATLAAVVFMIAVHLMQVGTLRLLWGLPSRGEFWVAVSTAVFVALVGVGGGILWAIVASIGLHLAHTTRPNSTVSVPAADGQVAERAVTEGVETSPGIIVYRFAANLYYANCSRLVADVRLLLDDPPHPLRLFVLDASEIHRVDWTSAEALRKAIGLVQAAGARFCFVRVHAEARPLLDFYGLTAMVGGDEGFYATAGHAVAARPRAADEPIGVGGMSPRSDAMAGNAEGIGDSDDGSVLPLGP